MRRPRALGAVSLLFALLAAPALAQAQVEVVVSEFAGPRASAVRREVVAALEGAGGVRVVTERSPASHAIVEGRVARAGRRVRAELRVVTPDGREIASESFAARRPGPLAERAGRWARGALVRVVTSAEAPAAPVAPALPPARSSSAPPAATPTRSSSAPTAVAPEAPAASAPHLPPPLAMSVGFAVVNRAFTYNDDIFGALVPYHLPAAPVVTGALEWFPGGHADLGALAGLSVRVETEVTVGLESVGSDGAVFGTDLWSLGAGLRYRLRIDDVELRVDAAYRAHVFTIHQAGETQPPPDVPNLEIHAFRAGGGLRWDVGAGLFFFGSGAYLAPLALGEIASEAWFPRATAGGVEAELGLGVRVDDVELRGFFAMRRFFYDMRSEPGDDRVAGGAVDEYLSGVLELTWRPSQLAQ